MSKSIRAPRVCVICDIKLMDLIVTLKFCLSARYAKCLSLWHFVRDNQIGVTLNRHQYFTVSIPLSQSLENNYSVHWQANHLTNNFNNRINLIHLLICGFFPVSRLCNSRHIYNYSSMCVVFKTLCTYKKGGATRN